MTSVPHQEALETELEKKYVRRQRKKQTRMKVSGRGVRELQNLIIRKGSRRQPR